MYYKTALFYTWVLRKYYKNKVIKHKNTAFYLFYNLGTS